MLRRSCATQAQRYATVKDTQTQMRHADPTITLKFYQQEIPESVKAAFTAMDEALFAETEAKSAVQ
jgi:integrase